MNEDQKFFGMTRVQIGILAVMAVVLILIVCVGGWFVFRNLNPAGSLVPQVTSTVAPTVTSVVVTSPTLTPTFAPTPIPYEQLIPSGWNQYKTSLVEIWVPKNFKLDNKKIKDDPSTPAIFELLITEIPSKSSAYNTRIGVSYELFTGDSLDIFLDNKLMNLPGQARIAERRTVFVNSVEARRVLIENRIDNVDENSLVYIFLDGSTIWYVEYAAQINEFYELLPVFEQSIKTFRPVKY